jgi:hypothetical protein
MARDTILTGFDRKEYLRAPGISKFKKSFADLPMAN